MRNIIALRRNKKIPQNKLLLCKIKCKNLFANQTKPNGCMNIFFFIIFWDRFTLVFMYSEIDLTSEKKRATVQLLSGYTAAHTE